MSQIPPTASSSSDFQTIFYASMKEYEKKTKKDLLIHPLMAQLQNSNSPVEILAVLRHQVQQFEQSMNGDSKLTRWLKPTVNVLYAFSMALGEGVGLAFLPAKVIFAGAGVLLLAAKDVAASQDALIEIFDRIENFFRRLEIYAEMPRMEAMRGTIVEIMVEVLGIFAIVTKEINQGRAKRYFKKLIGRKDIEDALKKLNILTQEEAWMGTAQGLKVAHGVEDRVKAVDGKIKAVDDKFNVVIKDGKETKALVQQTANNTEETKVLAQHYFEEAKWNQARRDHRTWLSPPDPSTNQNNASRLQRDGTATWFFQERVLMEWKSKSTTSLLWIHGKLGSGKSILCSAIIQDIMTLRDAGSASMAYFYFDFRDTNKQNLDNLLPSLLTQLSARSDRCCNIISRVHKAHDDGARKPSTSTLIECLKEMITLPGQGPIYIILDALDECPNTSGIPPFRKQVLDLLKDLVGFQHSNIHICVTSRPESDIQAALDPLALHSISIHDQSGQKKDIKDYIRFVVYADSGTAMERWRDKDKELVIETLTERVDGMFRWVYCQLEVLQHCLPQSIRRTLNELPNTLDETYERVLKEIGMANQDHALRLLQCLTVASRPLRVEELAEILAFNFNVAEGATPKLDENWRSEDPRRTVLSTCSSLITLAEDGDSFVVQFSHFSVKEFLISHRLSTAKDVSYFHIMTEPAHTTLARACLGTLLQFDGNANNTRVGGGPPLTKYAGRYWVDHAQFGTVSSRVEDGMRHLFDSARPYFSAWLQLHDIDDRWHEFEIHKTVHRGSPLYYASLCGFLDLAAHIIVEYPEQVNARCGRNHSPLVAALHKKHFNVAELLHRYGAAVDVTSSRNRTPLHAASRDGLLDVVQWLLYHDADANSQQDDHRTPIHLAAGNGHLAIVRILLGHDVRVNVANDAGHTPLHRASDNGHVEIVRLLLQHGADISPQDNDRRTPLHLASKSCGSPEIAGLLLGCGANPNAEDNNGRTPLHLASFQARAEIVRLLLDHDANPHAKDNDGKTPLHPASSWGRIEMARLLLDHDAKADAEDEDGKTPLYLVLSRGRTEIVRLLLDRGANVDTDDKDGKTPLYLASSSERSEMARLLLDRGANIDAKDKDGKTPLHLASSWKGTETARLLLNRGANVDVEDKDGRTPLHLAAPGWGTETVGLLLDRGANVDAWDKDGKSPLHLASSWGRTKIVRLLLNRGANVNSEDKDGCTPLHLASSQGRTWSVHLLLDHGASADAKDKEGRTPFQVVSGEGKNEIEQMLTVWYASRLRTVGYSLHTSRGT